VLTKGHRLLLTLGVAVAAAAAGIAIHDNHSLRRLEQLTIDARFQIRGTERNEVAGMVIVAIDDRTFSDFNRMHLTGQWPFPRRYEARVIDRLHRAGAKVIAVDIQFTEPSRSPADDNALIEAVGRAGNVVLATTDVGPHGSTNVFGGDGVLRQLRARAGNSSFKPDSDGTIRQTQYSILGLKTFGVVVAEMATHHTVSPSLFGGTRKQVPIDFAGPPGTIPAISFSRVYLGQFPAKMFAGKIVLVGATSPSLQDLHQTPGSGGRLMSGPEILGNAAATVLHRIPLREPAAWVTAALIVLLALLPCLAGLRLGTIGVALVGAGALVLWSIAAQLAFDSGTQFDYTAPAVPLVLATGGMVIVGWWADGRERRRLRQLFAANQATVVEQVLDPSGQTRLKPTAIIAGYRIDTAIAGGGMGVVYRATQLALERTVALKLIATARAQDPVFRARFKLESRLAASIEHPNVIPVYEAGEDDGLLYIAMRMVDGIDLAQLLAHEETLDAIRTARLIAQLAAALDAAHAHGLVHRDVKPANVLLTFDAPEHLYLTDFGVAKHVGADDGVTTGGHWVGTLDYLAPEQIRGADVGASGDIYALAGVLYRCLAGEVPFPRNNEPAKLWAHVNAKPPAPSRARPDLPTTIDEVVARGMAKDPTQRFATATDLSHAFSTALGVGDAATPTARPAITRGSEHGPGDGAHTVLSD
jgi:CHASE2 domain-containing sensor protein